MGEKRNRKKLYDARLDVKIPKYQLEYVKKRAKEDHMSVSEWIRNLLYESSRWKTF